MGMRRLSEQRPSAGGGSGAVALNDLTDVDTTGVGTGDVLAYDGASWVPATSSAPGAHASTHQAAGTDELLIESQGTAETDDTLVLKPDGAGGVAWGAPGGSGGNWSASETFECEMVFNFSGSGSIYPLNPSFGTYGTSYSGSGSQTIIITLGYTSRLTSHCRARFTAPTNSGAAEYYGAKWNRLAGIRYFIRFGMNAIVSNVSRVIAGVLTTGMASNNPSAITSQSGVYLGKDDTDTNWQIMHNDGSGSVVKVDTGIAVTADKIVEFGVWCAPSGDFYWELHQEGSANASGSLSTDIPAAATPLTGFHQVWSGGTGTTEMDVINLRVASRATGWTLANGM
jgi:hypothetical protein